MDKGWLRLLMLSIITLGLVVGILFYQRFMLLQSAGFCHKTHFQLKKGSDLKRSIL